MIKNLKNFECLHVLKSNYIAYLSYIWKNKPYAVPITYHYNNDENCIISYSGEGHKIDAMRLNNTVSVVITQIESVNKWQSILVHGKFEEFVGTHAKQQLHKFSQGVKKNMFIKDNKYPELISDFSSKTNPNSTPIIYGIKILEITGKLRAY